ncbi:MAG: DUF1573 domain-containing protein [Flavobacteriales bacterium]
MNARYFRLIAVFALLWLIHPQKMNAQSFKQWMELGQTAFDDGDYLTAALQFGKAYELDSASFDATIRLADAYRLSRNYSEAARLYDKAYFKDKGRLYPEGQYYLAQMLVLMGQHSDALRNFQKYERRLKRERDTPAYAKLQQEMAGCSLALAAREPDSDVRVALLENDVNTEKSEFAPYLLDSLLFYTTSAYGIAQMTAAYLDSTATEPSRLTGPWSGALPHGNLCHSPDRTRAYYTECIEAKCSIFEADVVDGELRNGRSLPRINQSDITCTMPWVGVYDGKEVLFFASDRAGTRGQLDIWWSFRQSNGEWDAPVNAGDNVNTPGNEITPYYSGTHLYFSSDWHPGFGGYDVFKSKGYPRSFDVPVNLDRPLNSSLNDLYFRYFDGAKTGFLASNRNGSISDGSFCCNDLYRVQFADSVVTETEIPDVFASLAELNDYLPVTLYFHNDEPNPRTREVTTRLTYEQTYDAYRARLNEYRKEVSRSLKGEDVEDAEYEVDEFFSFYIDKGMDHLRQFADLLLVELEKGYSIRLTIKGFASPRAKSDYNVNLTSRRINSLVNYLKTAKDGAFLLYIESRAENHATLSFEEVPFGEYQADKEVSDELDDRQASIYSRGARLERKIEVLSVQRGLPDSLFSRAEFNTTLVDFGQQSTLAPLLASVTLRNTGTDTLFVDSVLTECGCTAVELERTTLLPGEEAMLRMGLDPNGFNGVVTRKVLVFVRNREEPYEITLAGDFE